MLRVSILETVKQSSATLVLGASALLALSGVLVAESVVRYYDAQERLIAQMRHEAELSRSRTTQTLRSIDLALQQATLFLGTRPWAEIVSSRNDWRQLISLAASLPEIRSLSVVDQNGYLRLNTTEWPVPPRDAIDHDSFTAHAFDFRSGLYVARPVMELARDTSVVPVSRPFMVAQRSFRGVVIADVDPGVFLPSLDHEAACSACTATVFRTNGQKLARAGPAISATDQEAITQQLQMLSTDAEYQEVQTFEDLFDGRDGLAEFAPSPGYGVTVVVTAPTNATWGLWWESIRDILLAGIPAVLVLALLMRRAVQANRALVSARNASEQARQREHDFREEAAHANHAKSEFLAVMSHELRTPLNAIIGFSQIIRDRTFGPDSHRYTEYAEDIHNSGQHLLSLINDILDLSKIEAGRMDLSEDLVDLASVIDSVRRLTSVRAKEQGVSLSVETTELILHADERALKQMLLNLVTNAIKFTSPGGQITVHVRRDHAWLRIEVEDTGCGMTPEDITCALERFGQARGNRVHQSEGTGLGLNVTQEFAQLHGGDLDIDSTPDVGTLVAIRLPADRVSGPPSTKQGQQAAE